jgi:GT2 family glycosyltransferase
MSVPRVSVVVPTYRDWGRAADLVRALQAQTMPDFEILLVNNAPDDPPPADFPTDPRLRLLAEGAPGSYAPSPTAIAAPGQAGWRHSSTRQRVMTG